MTYPATPGYAPPETSRAAADSMRQPAPDLAARVFALISLAPKACFEVERELRLSHQTASARIRELALKGKIADSGERRKGPSGRKSIVWAECLGVVKAAPKPKLVAETIVARGPGCVNVILAEGQTLIVREAR